MAKPKYSEKKIRKILQTAYPGMSETELDKMVKETMAQSIAEAKGEKEKQ